MKLEDLLGKKFSEQNYNKFINNFFLDIKEKQVNVHIQTQFSQYIKNAKMIGEFIDNESRKLAILNVCVNNFSKARTTQRNFVASILSNGELIGYSGAMVAFHDEVQTNWKLALITIDYEISDSGINVSFKPAKRFSFLVGEGEPVKTYCDQLMPIYEMKTPPSFDDIKEAFSISKVTKDFYNDYCDCFIKLSNYLIDNMNFIKEANQLGYEDVKEYAITFTKKTLGQIVFLHFLQKKGWLGVPVDSEWGNGDKRFMCNSIKDSYSNYFNDILEPLFYRALNCKRENDLFKNEKIPFLNGGLFSPIANYNWQDTNFEIPNSIWFNEKETGFLNILSQYNFTVDESNPNEQDIAVDPEMLGRIFESLLDPSERHEKGAHYTPREIVHFMCIESLAYRISKELDISFADIKNYILYSNSLVNKNGIIEKNSQIDYFLRKITIVDPAVGSGAFLVGMLNEIVKLRMNLAFLRGESLSKYEIKKEAIQNSLYGVDIEYDAIEIARLRLWLSLIVDQNVEYGNTPHPLPNLAFQLRVGNSLVDEYHGVKLWDSKIKTKKQKKYNLPYVYNLFNVMDYNDILDKLNKAKELYFSITDDTEKNVVFTEIEKYQLELIKNTLHNNDNYSLFNEVEEMIKNRTKPFFLWELEFEKIWDEGGFDIVIANPPYIQLQNNGGKLADELKDQGYKTFARMGDIYALFYEKAHNLMKNKGVSCFITSNKWMRAGYGEKLREFLSENINPLLLVDFGGTKIFESATVDVNVLVYSKESNEEQTKSFLCDKYTKKELSLLVENAQICSFKTKEPWVILNEIECSIKSKIEKYGTKLGDLDYSINYGIKTGYNDAFIIDENKYKEIIAIDPNSAEIIRPILRGRDIKRYTYDDPKLWMIIIPFGYTNQNRNNENPEEFIKNKFPAIYRHFLNIIEIDKSKSEKKKSKGLLKRDDQGEYWWELRSCKLIKSI